jgi:hypothetical protein
VIYDSTQIIISQNDYATCHIHIGQDHVHSNMKVGHPHSWATIQPRPHIIPNLFLSLMEIDEHPWMKQSVDWTLIQPGHLCVLGYNAPIVSTIPIL